MCHALSLPPYYPFVLAEIIITRRLGGDPTRKKALGRPYEDRTLPRMGTFRDLESLFEVLDRREGTARIGKRNEKRGREEARVEEKRTLGGRGRAAGIIGRRAPALPPVGHRPWLENFKIIMKQLGPE